MHQALLLLREFELSLQVFDASVRLLELHMRHEEEWLMPLYRQRGALPRFPEVLYLGQHRKMRAQLRALRAQLVALENGPGVLAAIISAFDREASYKHLAEHHDGAEAQGLFKALDGAAGEAECDVAQRCRDEFSAALAPSSPLLSACRARVNELAGS